MGNVPIFLFQEPSKTKDNTSTPSSQSFPANYSQSHTTSNIPNQAIQPIRKKSSFLEDDAESYNNP